MSLKRFLSILFIVTFSSSFGIIIFGEAGLITAFEKSQKKVQIEEKIASIKKHNLEIEERVKSLKSNPYVLEYYVRKVANLAAKDEIIFEFE